PPGFVGTQRGPQSDDGRLSGRPDLGRTRPHLAGSVLGGTPAWVSARLGLGPLDWVSACSTASCGRIHHDLVLDFEVDPPAGDISGLGRLCPSGGGPAGQRRSISTKTTSSVPSGFEISCSAPAARV